MDRIRRLHKSKSSSSKIGGTPEIHKEKGVSKLASPNVVARLMGLEGFPSQEEIRRPQKRHPDDNIQKTSPEMSQRYAYRSEVQSYKNNYVEQPEFKDVYEDTIRKPGYSKGPPLEFLQHPDSLFVEHLLMQEAPSSTTYNHIAVLKPSNCAKYAVKSKGWRAEREDSQKDDIAREQIHKDDYLRHTSTSHCSKNLIKSSIIHEDRKGESDTVAKRIVILKPNYVNTHNDFSSFSSPNSSQFNFSDYRSHEQYTPTSMAEYYFRNMEVFEDVGTSRPFSKHKSREAAGNAKKATREMRENSRSMMNRIDAVTELNRELAEDFGYRMTKFSSPVRGSPGTRDLYNFSGNISASISEGTKLTNHDLKESSVSSEAKKRLLERLRMAHKYHGVGVNSKGSPLNDMYQDVIVDDKKITLGEMLSTPDVKMRNLDVVMEGISSRDGWSDSYSNMSSRVRSVRPLSGRANEKQNTEREHRTDDKLLVPKEDMYQGQREGVNKNGKEKENISSKSLRSSKRISQPDHQRYTYNSNSLLERHSNQDQMKTKVDTKVSREEQLVVPQTPNKEFSIRNAACNIEHRCGTMSLRSSDELPPELSICIRKCDDSCAGDQVDTTPQCTKAEAEPSESSKEADHPSPVSVLEVPQAEDNVSSGPESFEQVSADLRELQKQLKLLRRESQAYAETSILLYDDNDVQQEPVRASENREIHQADCWESSYIIDVLTESGFNHIDSDMFDITWYSPDSPLGQWVFDNLENKHYGERTRLKHERKLLFDRINSALLEIPSSFTEPCPWVRPSTAEAGLKRQKYEIKVELQKLLAVQEKEATEEDLEKLLDKEMNWMGSRDIIDVIGMEIEKLLTDELLTELAMG